MKRIQAYLAILMGAVYLLNPGLGVFELIPDNLPVFGNLDEGAAMVLFLWGWRSLRESSNQNDHLK